MINWLMCTGYASRHDNLRLIPPYIKENNHLYLSGGSVFSSHFPWVRLLYHYLCQWRPSEIYQTVTSCESFAAESLSTVNPVTSLHAPSLPPNLLPTSSPSIFVSATNFHSHRTLSATAPLSLSCNFSERKKTTCLAHCLFLSFSLSPLLNFTSPLLGLFLSLSFALCVCLLEAARERERVQPHFWHIGSFPLGLRLAAHQHQQVTQEQGRNRKWAACGGDSSLEGLSGSAPLAFIARPSPCQSAEQGT